VFIYKAILGACRILHSILGLKVISLSLSRSLSLSIYIYGILHTRYIYDTSRAEDATLQHVSLGCCQREDARGCILCSTCVVGLLSNRGCTVGLQCKHRTCNVGLHMQRCTARHSMHSTASSMHQEHQEHASRARAPPACHALCVSVHMYMYTTRHATPCRPASYTHTHTHTHIHTHM